jgi:hypothetical protein
MGDEKFLRRKHHLALSSMLIMKTLEGKPIEIAGTLG